MKNALIKSSVILAGVEIWHNFMFRHAVCSKTNLPFVKNVCKNFLKNYQKFLCQKRLNRILNQTEKGEKMKKEINGVVKEVLEDFSKRVSERKSFDLNWRLNMNFYMGNQFCSVGLGSIIDNFDREYFWQEREVFNHIAPKIDIRLAKLSKIKPKMRVVPASNDESDIYTAKMSKKILDSVANKHQLSQKINQATKWSEICGTSFYKVFWNSNLGQVVAIEESGRKIKTGDVDVLVCSPFEIYPDSVANENLEDCQSIIHAKVYSKEEIKDMYGVEVEGSDINIFSLDNTISLGGLGINGLGARVTETTKQNSSIVIEKYVRPSEGYPNGRLIIVAGDELVFDGDLPYINGTDGKRDFPFIKQVCCDNVGSFWGVSLIDRMIPIQRAYNAVKNRKHEYLNRLTLGVLSVEDGSVDIDNLEEEGLAPGKILVYRQGANPPRFLDTENLPADFEKEEERLLEEFTSVSGTNEMGAMDTISSSISGTALELLIDENETRLSFTTDSIKNAIKEIGKQILRLFKQYATFPRLTKILGDNGDVEIFYFKSSDISSDDVELETEIESNDTLTQRRNMVYTLLEKGILFDENGKISATMKNKILEMIGFGNYESAVDIESLHTKRADSENLEMFEKNEVEVKTIDDHALHINEHIAFMLSGNFYKEADKDVEEIFLKHIEKHKNLVKEG